MGYSSQTVSDYFSNKWSVINLSVGFFPGVAMDYGLVTFLAFLWGFKKMCFQNLFSYEFFLWVILFFASPINTYVFWFSLMLLFVNKYFLNAKYKANIKKNSKFIY
jgi:hypothetical protein